MNLASLIPLASSISFGRQEKPLKGDNLPEYLRRTNFDPNTEFETVFVPETGLIVYPTVVDSASCIPVYNGELLPVSDYTRLSLGIRFAPQHGGKIIYLYRPKMSYGSGSVRDDNVNYRSDIMSAAYLKYGARIQDVVTTYKPFRISAPFEFAPDKIAQEVYQDYTYWSIIMQYNGFIYQEQLTLDLLINIPDYNEVNAWLKQIGASSTNSGVASQTSYKGTRVRL